MISIAFLGNQWAWSCTSTPSSSSMTLLLLEGRASHGHSPSQSIAEQLTTPGKFPAHAHSVPLTGQKHWTICREEGGNREGKEPQGKLRPSKRGVQWTMVQHQAAHSWGSKPNLAANKLCQQPWANRFCSFYLVQTWHSLSFLPSLHVGISYSVW